jgi:hypothetical protein
MSHITQYLIQQIARSVLSNSFSFTALAHVSTSKGASSGRYIQRHTNTTNSFKDVPV